MKKLSLLIAFISIVFASMAQYTQSIAPKSVEGNETIYLKTESFKKGGTISLQALCTQTGGTTDGTIVLQGSVDGVSFTSISSADGLFYGFPNDTLTMTNGAIGLWVIKDNPFLYIRFKVAGTASDTTSIAAKYISKN